MADQQQPVHYGTAKEYYYKENGQWFQKSNFFADTFIKRAENLIPKEYLEAEAKRGTRKLSVSLSLNGISAQPISFASKKDSAVQRSLSKDDDKSDSEHNKLQPTEDAPKEENAFKPEKVKIGSKKYFKTRLAIYDERSKNRSRYFTEALKKSMECENRPETQALVKSNNPKRPVRGSVQYFNAASKSLELCFDDFFHIEDLMEFAASKNVTVINAYQFMTVNTSRSAYFDASRCVYCAEHGTPSAHSPEVQCPLIQCPCVKCFALDLVKPDGL